MALLKSLLATGAGYIPVVGPVASSFINSYDGGAGDPGAAGICPNQPSLAELQTIIAKWTPAEKLEFSRLHALANVSDPLNLGNLPHLAFQIAGGSDCTVSSATGKTWIAYYSALRNKYITGEINGELSPAAIAAQQAADGGVGAQVRAAWDDILTAGKEIITSTVTGAVSGARTASAGSGSALELTAAEG